MNNGWIKLHRKLLDNPIVRKPAWLALWVTLLLLANHNDDQSFIWNGKIQKLDKGQFITGRKKLSQQTGIPMTTIERALDYFESGHQIRQQKTTKYRLITILKWEDYQKVDSKTDNKRTTNGQQTDTFKNIKKYKKDKNTTSDGVPSQDVVDVIDSFKPINPSYQNWFKNKTQRGACERLIKVHTKQLVLQAIAVLPKSNKIQYLPTITTPIQLEDKWAALEAGLIKKKAELQTKNNYVL